MAHFLDISRVSKRFETDGVVFEALKDVDLKHQQRRICRANRSLRMRQIHRIEHIGRLA